MYEPTDAEELEDPYWGNPIRRTMEEERVKEEIARWSMRETPLQDCLTMNGCNGKPTI